VPALVIISFQGIYFYNPIHGELVTLMKQLKILHMEKYQILDYKNRKFLNPQQFDKAFDKGDIIIDEGIPYFVIDCEFPTSIGPMICVWPAKLSFPSDFIDNSILFHWLRNHLRGLIVEFSNMHGDIIKGTVVDLFPDVTFKIFPDYSAEGESYNYYPVDCIRKVKVILLDKKANQIPIDIPLDQYPIIEIKGNY